ncbi:DNA replication licensing factor MCM2 [Pancytospora epiphaga]|nr:DNA replication licensing factor MCM2 [Pancytospora epiphaga]
MAKRRLRDSDDLETDSSVPDANDLGSIGMSDLDASEITSGEIGDYPFSPENSSILEDDYVYGTNPVVYTGDDNPYREPILDNNQTVPEHLIESAPLSSATFRRALSEMLVKFFTGSEKYINLIRTMCSENKESIDVDYNEMVGQFTAIETEPSVFIEILGDALTRVTRVFFPSYHLIKKQIIGRIVNLPLSESLRDLRNVHLNRLVRVSGIITRRTGVFSEYSLIKYTCTKCKVTFGPFVNSTSGNSTSRNVVAPSTCFECQGKGPFIVNSSETIYKDFQRATLQEIPGTVPSGSLPRSREIVLCHDLIDGCKPGDEVDVTGVYKNSYSAALNAKNGFPVFSTVIEASSVVKNTTGTSQLTVEDIKEIKALSKNPSIVDLLIDSVAPSIYGHRDVKTAVLLAMVGGEPKEREGMRIRGDINVLLMGDPGTAKSQFLRFVNATSHRAVLATGQGSSGVGLTASVRKDTAINEWVLEGGALVLADNGVCLIDEFDKMNETDRVAIHEAMEQQSISISKAGIVASLHARCSVIAAANPVRGRYNPSLSFAQNINLSDPIVSRFDVLCVIKDTIDSAEDAKMGRFILSNHFTSLEGTVAEENKTGISMDILKKYLQYAKTNIHPVISHVDAKKISQLYSDLRKESLSSGVPITVRHVEAIMRIGEAFAKLRLSNTVSKRDVDDAISLTLGSFLSSQKISVFKQLKRKFGKYFSENIDDLALYILKQMAAEVLSSIASARFTQHDFIARCKNNGVEVGQRFFDSETFKSAGFSIDGEYICRVC